MAGKNLYTFSSLNCTDAGAPKATPSSYSGIAQNGNGFIGRDSLSYLSPGIINVVNDFQWTTSPQGATGRQEVPRIELREKRLKTNAIIAAAAYYLMSASGTIGALGSRVQSVLSGYRWGPQIWNLFGGAGNESANFLGSIMGGGGGKSFDTSIVSSATRLFLNQDLSSIISTQLDGLNSELLRPYEGLYITEDTGFRYILPYFDDQQTLVTNAFSVNDEMFGPSSLLGKAVSKVRGATEALAKLAYFTEPGLYIEKPKFYNFKSSGDRITFSFPLINTGWSTYDDVKLNWQLAFLLSYQNVPNRRTRELIDPSVIYEVSIPGVKYIPYAYISQLKVDYLGSRRQMNLEVPSRSGAKSITTIVPEAYIITITLEGLVAETQNFLMAVLEGKQDIVSVVSYDRFNPFSESKRIFEDELSGLGAFAQTS